MNFTFLAKFIQEVFQFDSRSFCLIFANVWEKRFGKRSKTTLLNFRKKCMKQMYVCFLHTVVTNNFLHLIIPEII